MIARRAQAAAGTASNHGQVGITAQPPVARRTAAKVTIIANEAEQATSGRSRADADANAPALGRRACLSLLAAAAPALAAATLAAPAHARTAPGDWSSPGLASRPEDDDGGPVFTKTPSGARLQIVDPGSRGDPIEAPPLGADGAVAPGDRVELDYTLRRLNGYFIYGTVEGVSFQPRDVPTGVVELTMGGPCGGPGGPDGPGSAPAVIRGLEEALVGLRAGARFRVLVPPAIGYTDGGAGGLGPLPPTFATKRQLLNHVKEPLLFEGEVLKVKKRKV